MKTIAILASSALLVNAGTNKTLAPTPGVIRPNAPPPITPFPTEPNVVRLLYIVVLCCGTLFVAVRCSVAWFIVVVVQRDGSCKIRMVHHQ